MSVQTEAIFRPLGENVRASLETLCAVIEDAVPIPPRFAMALPRDIAELSRLLTSERPLRHDGYLGEPRLFSAYCRYFLPWNVWRLCRLFSSLNIVSEGALTDDAVTIADLGAGPMTLACALWAAFPALRTTKLTIFAIDRNKNALSSGKKIFGAFAGAASPWRIITRNARIEDPPENAPPARLTAVIYALNELFSHIAQADTERLRAQAEKIAARLARRTAREGAILIAEPGVPRSAQYLVFLKEAFERQGFFASAPCPPQTHCPARGGKRPAKWCHFVFDTEDSPARLQHISARAGLPKERAALSFLLLTGKSPASVPETFPVRVLSDPFTLEGARIGRYGCSSAGLILLRGSWKTINALESGSALRLPSAPEGAKDAKSGAFIMDLAEL